MDKLQKAYEAVEMLKDLGLPISSDQTIAIAQMEKQYLREEVIPLITQEMEPLVEQMRNKFSLEVTYTKESGLDIQLVEKKPVQETFFPSNTKSPTRQKKYIIKPESVIRICVRVVFISVRLSKWSLQA